MKSVLWLLATFYKVTWGIELKFLAQGHIVNKWWDLNLGSLYHCVTNYPQTYWLNTILTLSQLCGSGIWTWLRWVFWLPGLSRGCLQDRSKPAHTEPVRGTSCWPPVYWQDSVLCGLSDWRCSSSLTAGQRLLLVLCTRASPQGSLQWDSLLP